MTLPSGVQYVDVRIGGGQRAASGLLMVLQLKCVPFDAPGASAGVFLV